MSARGALHGPAFGWAWVQWPEPLRPNKSFREVALRRPASPGHGVGPPSRAGGKPSVQGALLLCLFHGQAAQVSPQSRAMDMQRVASTATAGVYPKPGARQLHAAGPAPKVLAKAPVASSHRVRLLCGSSWVAGQFKATRALVQARIHLGTLGFLWGSLISLRNLFVYEINILN